MEIRLKKSLKGFKAYSTDKTDYTFRLNANESPFEYKDMLEVALLEKKSSIKSVNLNKINNQLKLNRYPDPLQLELKKDILNFYSLKKGQVLLGNGSDELILNLLLTLTGKSSKVLYLEPSFSMYKILTKGLGLRGVGVSLTSEFKLNTKKVLKQIDAHDPDIIFIASPNNPTGNSFEKEEILKIIKHSKGLVVVDEAYSDYSNVSCISLLKQNKDLLIMKTMSKVGFAGIRLGFILGDKRLIDSIENIRLPYNISAFSQLVARSFFKDALAINPQLKVIKQQRFILSKYMKDFPDLKVFPSDSNFILIKLKKALQLFNFLKSKDLIVKSFPKDKILGNCLRITVGSPRDNKKFMSLLSSFFNK